MWVIRKGCTENWTETDRLWKLTENAFYEKKNSLDILRDVERVKIDVCEFDQVSSTHLLAHILAHFNSLLLSYSIHLKLSLFEYRQIRFLCRFEMNCNVDGVLNRLNLFSFASKSILEFQKVLQIYNCTWKNSVEIGISKNGLKLFHIDNFHKKASFQIPNWRSNWHLMNSLDKCHTYTLDTDWVDFEAHRKCI